VHSSLPPQFRTQPPPALRPPAGWSTWLPPLRPLATAASQPPGCSGSRDSPFPDRCQKIHTPRAASLPVFVELDRSVSAYSPPEREPLIGLVTGSSMAPKQADDGGELRRRKLVDQFASVLFVGHDSFILTQQSKQAERESPMPTGIQPVYWSELRTLAHFFLTWRTTTSLPRITWETTSVFPVADEYILATGTTTDHTERAVRRPPVWPVGIHRNGQGKKCASSSRFGAVEGCVLHSLGAASSQESYGHAVDEFIGWYVPNPTGI
jgi:hypothetical protein